MVRFSPILLILGWLISAFGACMVIPALYALIIDSSSFIAFSESAAFTLFVGMTLILMNQQTDLKLRYREGFVITVAVWVSLSCFAAIPFYISGASHGSMVDALFESISCFTATGSTVFSDLDMMEKPVLFWRSFIQWIGGMGIVVLAVAILPFLGVGGMQLYKSELPGVSKDKLQPRLKETARALWGVYVSLTALCAVAYVIAGMEWFDAICHAFTTLSTGGISTHDASLGYYNNVLIEVVAMCFMLVGAMNFTLHYYAFKTRDPLSYWRQDEVTLFMIIVGLAITLSTIVLMANHTYFSWFEALRRASFHVISILTTTGFGTTDYNTWPAFIPLLFMILMFIGGCSGSTSGGMKMLRILVIIRQGTRELKRLLHPHIVTHVKVAKTPVSSHVMQAIWGFAGLYLLSFMLVALALSAFNIDLVTAFSTAAATLTNVGPGLGTAGPASTYAHFPDAVKLIFCFSMLLGRLEMLTILIIFIPGFWRK